jgi:hypothetical protein
MGDLSLKGIVRVFRKEVPDHRIDPSNFSVLELRLEGKGIHGYVIEKSLRSNLENWARIGIGAHFREDCGDHNPISQYSLYTQVWTHITMEVLLVSSDINKADLRNLMPPWIDGIRLVWSINNSWSATSAGELTCRFTFDVRFVTEKTEYTGWAVQVQRCPTSTCNENSAHWFDTTTGFIAAHEFGHFLGFKDEYVDINRCPDRNPVDTHTIMDNTQTSPVNEIALPSRFMQPFAKNIESDIVHR